jgi:hypothetical protein
MRLLFTTRINLGTAHTITSNNQLKPGTGYMYTNYTVRTKFSRAGMNSVTGESGPVSIDRPRPAISHEV